MLDPEIGCELSFDAIPHETTISQSLSSYWTHYLKVDGDLTS